MIISYRYSQCIDFLTNAMKLPIFQNGGGYILLLSIYELSNEFIQSIQLLEKVNVSLLFFILLYFENYLFRI